MATRTPTLYHAMWEDVTKAASQISYKNVARFRLYDHADLMQEAFIVFQRCQQKYSPLKTKGAFLAVFRTSFNNRIKNLIRSACIDPMSMAGELPTIVEVVPLNTARALGNDNYGYLEALLAELPKEVAVVLNQTANGTLNDPRKINAILGASKGEVPSNVILRLLN